MQARRARPLSALLEGLLELPITTARLQRENVPIAPAPIAPREGPIQLWCPAGDTTFAFFAGTIVKGCLAHASN